MGKKHLWELEFWEDDQGNCPAADAMRALKSSNSVLFEFVCEKIRRFSEDWEIKNFLGSKYITDLKNGLWEYKITAAKNEFRMLGIIENFAVPPQFLCFHCFHKKSKKIPLKHIKISLQRLAEYKRSKNKK